MLHVVVLVSVGGTVTVGMGVEEKHVLWTSVVAVCDVAVGPLLACDWQRDSHHWEPQMAISYRVILVSLWGIVVLVTEAEVDLNLVAPSQMVVLPCAEILVEVVMDVAVAPAHMVAGMDAEVELNLVAPSHMVVLVSVEEVVVVVMDMDAAPGHEMLWVEVGEVATVVAKTVVMEMIHILVCMKHVEESSNAVGSKEKQRTNPEDTHAKHL